MIIISSTNPTYNDERISKWIAKVKWRWNIIRSYFNFIHKLQFYCSHFALQKWATLFHKGSVDLICWILPNCCSGTVNLHYGNAIFLSWKRYPRVYSLLKQLRICCCQIMIAFLPCGIPKPKPSFLKYLLWKVYWL